MNVGFTWRKIHHAEKEGRSIKTHTRTSRCSRITIHIPPRHTYHFYPQEHSPNQKPVNSLLFSFPSLYHILPILPRPPNGLFSIFLHILPLLALLFFGSCFTPSSSTMLSLLVFYGFSDTPEIGDAQIRLSLVAFCRLRCRGFGYLLLRG